MARSKEDVAAVIRRLVAEAGTVLGSRLAMALKAEVPEWKSADYGASSLRDFIVANVEGVRVAARSGMDVVYSCSGSACAETLSMKIAPPVDAWRAWVSPNGPYSLAFNQGDGTVLLIPRSDSPPDEQICIEPASVDDHRVIARGFLDRVPETARDHMRELSESSDDFWWRDWLAELDKLGVSSSWLKYRHERLVELLQSRLEAAGLEPLARAAALDAIIRSKVQGQKRSRHGTGARHHDIREVAAAVLELMSDEDLRGLKLPVGLVLDVLGETKS